MPCPLISRRLKLATGEISTVERPTSEGRQFVAAMEALLRKTCSLLGVLALEHPGASITGTSPNFVAKCDAAMGCGDVVIQSLDLEGFRVGTTLDIILHLTATVVSSEEAQALQRSSGAP